MKNQDKKNIKDVLETEELEKNVSTSQKNSEEVEEWQKKAEEYLNGWKRCQADFENYKKNQENLRKDFLQFANENLILEILPVLDNFQASLEHIPEDQKNNSWVVGINHIQKQLENILKNNGIKEIKVQKGDEFDPRFHEAIIDNSQLNNFEKKEKEEEKNKIFKIVQKGYTIGDKVIRPTRVIIE